MSHFNTGDTVIIIDENRNRPEIGEYTIESVGRNFFYVRDSFGRAKFSLVDGFEHAVSNRYWGRQAFTPQDWELESKYRRLAADFDDLGVTFRNIRKHSTRKLETILTVLEGPEGDPLLEAIKSIDETNGASSET